MQASEPVGPSRKVDELQVVDVTSSQFGIDDFSRARPATLDNLGGDSATDIYTQRIMITD